MREQLPSIECWFLHEDLVLKLLGPTASQQLARRMPREGEPFAQIRTRNLLEHALADFMQRTGVPSLNELHLDRRLETGTLVWLDQALHFRGVEAAYYRALAGEHVRASLWGKLSTDNEFQVHADLNAARITSNTGANQLKGTSRHFTLAYVQELLVDRVILRPVAIGHRYFVVGDYRIPIDVNDAAHVWPQQVDQLKEVDFARRVEKSDLEMLRHVPEEAVKQWFAEIVGEPEVPKDWGGEQYDLWTRRLTIDGQPVRAAVAFKGPAAFHPMQIADLGKNGDQIQRLAHSPADLLVVQHCHTITSSVEHMLRTVATSPAHVRRYMLIDGYATATILKHFEYLPIRP